MREKKYFLTSKLVALFGNPVRHSLSPKIHNYFSSVMNIKYIYTTILCNKENFSTKILNFFEDGGIGANITVPFKTDAYSLFKKHSLTSKISHTVNTISISDKNKELTGHNTDGIGLIYDLKRLNFIKKNIKILLLGAGGAAQAVISSLLDLSCSITILNRTLNNANVLVKKFKKFGKILVFNPTEKYDPFDLIINATSSGIYNTVPKFPTYLINSNTHCYDMYYVKNSNYTTPFIYLCKKLGAKYCSDGLGMLVAQAAYSFYCWFNIMPDILSTMLLLRQDLNKA